MCSLSGIPERAGNHPRYPYNIYPQSRYTGQCHIHTRMLEILDAAGIPMLMELPRACIPRRPTGKWCMRGCGNGIC